MERFLIPQRRVVKMVWPVNDLMSLIQNENPCGQLLFLILFDFLRADTIIQSTYEIMHLGI